MPEMTFTIIWPDGQRMNCYSPSLVIHDYLSAGQSYPVQEFVDRSCAALDEAADRVKERFGFTCTSAVAQQDKILAVAARYLKDTGTAPAEDKTWNDGGRVSVLNMVPPLEAERRVEPLPEKNDTHQKAGRP